MKTAVIVGGGVTGLAASYHLQKKAAEAGLSLRCLVVEKDPRLGGKIVTEKENGFLIEGGPDCFVREKPSVITLSEQLGITDKLLPSNDATTGTYVLCGGKLHQLPDGLMLLVPTKIIPFALSPLITWPGKIRMGLDLLLPRKKGNSDESLASFVKRRLGQEALDKIGEPLIGGIHGGNSQTMSLKASFPRFLQMEKDYRSLIVAMLAARAKRPAPVPPKPGEAKKTYFMSFKGGMADLIEGLTAKLDSANLLTSSAVESIEQLPGEKYQVHIAGHGQVTADAVILTAPAWDAAAILAELDQAVSDKLRGMPQASSATINLVYRREDVPGDLDSFGFVIPASEKRNINALTFSSVKWDHRVPSAAYVSVRTFVGGSRNQELALLPDDKLVETSRRDLQDILGIKAEPMFSRVHHWIEARPQYILGHLDTVKSLDERLAQYHPGLFLAGASYRGIGVPDCVNDGIKAAEAALTHLTHNSNHQEAAR